MDFTWHRVSTFLSEDLSSSKGSNIKLMRIDIECYAQIGFLFDVSRYMHKWKTGTENQNAHYMHSDALLSL